MTALCRLANIILAWFMAAYNEERGAGFSAGKQPRAEEFRLDSASSRAQWRRRIHCLFALRQ
jgi:uncharacterized MAPEG superfamily protein